MLALSSRAALAEPELLTPTDATGAALVTGGGLSGVFHRIEPGQSLDFATPGFATLTVEVHRRLPAVGARPAGARVQVLGDGNPVMEIIAGQPALPGAKVHDGRGGAVSGADRATVKVPADGRRLTLVAPSTGLDLLVQVRGDATPR